MSSRDRKLRRRRASLRVDGGHGSINFRIGQKPPDPACQMALETAYGFNSGLALGLLSSEVVLSRRMNTALGHGNAVKGAVELTVAAAVEPVAGAPARGGGDRSNAGETGQLGIRREARGAGGLGEELCRRQRPAAGEVEQLRGLGARHGADLALEPRGASSAIADRPHQLTADANAGALLGAGELASNPIEPDDAIQGARRQLQLGPEVMQVPAQALLVLCAGPDEVLAVVEQQLQLQGGLVEVGGGQGLGTLAQRCPGDGEGVDRDRTCRGCARLCGPRPSASAGLARRARPRRPGNARRNRRRGGSPRSPRSVPLRVPAPRRGAHESRAPWLRRSARRRADRFPQRPRRRCG